MDFVHSVEQSVHHSFEDGFDIAKALGLKALCCVIVPAFFDDSCRFIPLAECALKSASTAHQIVSASYVHNLYSTVMCRSCIVCSSEKTCRDNFRQAEITMMGIGGAELVILLVVAIVGLGGLALVAGIVFFAARAGSRSNDKES